MTSHHVNSPGGLVQEMLTGSLEMERAKQEAMAGLLKRQPSLHAALPQARVAQHHQRIQELSAQAAQLHTAILTESSRQRPVSTALRDLRLDLLISALALMSHFVGMALKLATVCPSFSSNSTRDWLTLLMNSTLVDPQPLYAPCAAKHM